MKKIITLSITIIVVLFLAVISICYFSYNNKEISLRKQALAQEEKIEVVYDKVWKVIQQKVQVSNEYKNAFTEIYPQLMEGRYGGEGDGTLMKWITESNPNFDTSLYKDLSQSIEVLRTEFQKNQERMLDIIREHSTLCERYPSRWFISNKEPIEYEVISSTKSKMVMETRMEDDIDLFN